MAVRSTPPTSAPVARKTSASAWAVGLVVLAFGFGGWLAGGKYTVEGWIVWLNWFLVWVGFPFRVPPVAGWGLLIILPVALVYSRVEVAHRPVWRSGGQWHFAEPIFWIAWLLIVGTDVGSTYAGVRSPSPDAFLVTRQVAAVPWLSVVWAVLLTFSPEWLIIAGLKLLRR